VFGDEEADMTPTNRKAYDIRFENRSDHLYVYLKGSKTDFESSSRYWSEIVGMNSLRHYDRVLIEKDLNEALTTGEVFNVLSNVAFVSRDRVKFAIFDHNYDYRKNQFEEVVATNRGLDIKIFDEMDKAKEWLLGH
jgi:hypothetical protein